jgi:hypothetical protein
VHLKQPLKSGWLLTHNVHMIGSPGAHETLLARTIADLVGNEEIQSVHLAEALQYCQKLMLTAG